MSTFFSFLGSIKSNPQQDLIKNLFLFKINDFVVISDKDYVFIYFISLSAYQGFYESLKL